MNPSYLKSPAALALLDSVNPAAIASRRVLDGADDTSTASGASAYSLQDTSLKAVAAVQAWCETDDLAGGEGSGDRLMAMLIGIADENKDGELSDDEQTVVGIAINAAWDYMGSKGVSDADLSALFESEDPTDYNGAGDRVMEFLADNMPDGDEAATDDASDFAFGPDAQASVFDAVYKKRFAVRAGRKVVIRKRISGHVRLSAKQKVSIRKMLMKSHGAKASAHRMKSMRVRKSRGM